MKILKYLKPIFIFVLCFLIYPTTESNGGFDVFDFAFLSETDTAEFQLYSAYDLRDRESFIQITNTDSGAVFPDGITVHVQIFDVGNNCIENNFFDTYTPSDTHVYNMRDIQTNNGNPSGVVLPENSFGIVIVSLIGPEGFIIGLLEPEFNVLLGNFRILDNQGYEYRTNSTGIPLLPNFNFGPDDEQAYYINFNTETGTILSDIFGISVGSIGIEEGNDMVSNEVEVANPTENFTLLDVDLFNLNEIPFSCRNIIFACITPESPRYQELLESVADNADGSASVANFEYGINEAIPNSKSGELLCPSNNISEGFARLTVISHASSGNVEFFTGFVGLNNGNGRGSMDSFWAPKGLLGDDDDD